MGIFIGTIEKKGFDLNVFFNFKPIAEVRNGEVIQLKKQEQELLLPKSERRNICFNYNWKNDEENIYPQYNMDGFHRGGMRL